MKGLRKSLILPFILLNTLNHPSHYRLPPISFILSYTFCFILISLFYFILSYSVELSSHHFRLTLHYHIITLIFYHPPPPPVILLCRPTLHSVTHSMILSDKHLIVTILTYPPPTAYQTQTQTHPPLYHNLSQHVLLK